MAVLLQIAPFGDRLDAAIYDPGMAWMALGTFVLVVVLVVVDEWVSGRHRAGRRLWSASRPHS